MIQIFITIRSSILNFNVDIVVDTNKSIIDSTKNIDYFDSKYENSIDKNFSIIIFDRHIFYRDVFIFIDKFENLKKKKFRFKNQKVRSCLHEKRCFHMIIDKIQFFEKKFDEKNRC